MSTHEQFNKSIYTHVKSQENHDVQLSEEELHNLIKNISSFDKTGQDFIFLLIRIHSIKQLNEPVDLSQERKDIPYAGDKVGNEVVKFDLRNFPPILNRMLLLFSTLHSDRLKLEKNRS